MTAATFILIFLAFCALGMVIALVLPDGRNPAALAVIASLAAPTLLAGSGAVLLGGTPPHVTLWNVPMLGQLKLDMDRLSALFAFITALVYLPVSIFSPPTCHVTRGTTVSDPSASFITPCLLRLCLFCWFFY
jgi:formate hydrogenlyase subunit 3/multisubunit Na+/H+ antiporter MnhD subunit